MTLEAALTSPTYSIPLDPSTKSVTLCVLCPGKVLKNDGMVKDHLASTVRPSRLSWTGTGHLPLAVVDG